MSTTLKTCLLICVLAALAVFSHVFSIKNAQASLFGENVQQVGLQANGLAGGPVGGGDISIVGDSALLPDAGPTGTAADIADEPSSDQISIYVVRSGDTVSTIAKMFHVTSNTIIWANDLSAKAVLKEGQVLVILPVSGIRHTVAKGETLQSIAKKYKGDVEEITQFNNLEDGQLAVGDVVIIPDGEAPVVAKPSVPGNSYRGGSGPSYAGYYMRPISGGIKTQGLHGYNGVDLAASLGTPVMASADGTVIVSKSGGWNGGYGNYVVIQHPNGTQTLYAHLSSNKVGMGQHVDQGQTIGALGSTGKSTGPHVHFEIRGAKNPF